MTLHRSSTGTRRYLAARVGARVLEPIPPRVELRSQLPLVGAQSARAWGQLAYEGEWKGHPAGPFQLTRAVFESFVANFERQANAIPLTYEHPQYAGDGRPVPAAGWIHQLRIQGTSRVELWGLIEYTRRGEALVREGEYRFVSVVFGKQSTDRQSGDDVGPELFEVGLTNVPFLDGMTPLAL